MQSSLEYWFVKGFGKGTGNDAAIGQISGPPKQYVLT